MKLYVLEAGDMICSDGSQLSNHYELGMHIPLANPIFLIKHEKGNVLWDTGLPDRLMKEKEGVENWIFRLKVNKTVLGQLHELGLQPSDIDYLAFSHMHIDHTGNANYFSQSTIIMQEAEYAYAFDMDNKPMNFKDYEALGNSKFMRLQDDHDLFGDGKITFISTPGHTLGHQSLMLRLEESTIIISGDISYTQHHFDVKGIPSFNTNAEQSLHSIEKIHRWVKQHGAQLWVQHDKAQFDLLKLSPEYYQ